MSGRDRKRHVGGTLDTRRRVKDGDTKRSWDWEWIDIGGMWKMEFEMQWLLYGTI